MSVQLLLFSPVTTFSIGLAIVLMCAIPWKEFFFTGSSQEVQKVQPCSLCWLIRFLRSAWPPPTPQWTVQITALFRLQLPHEMRSFHARCCVRLLGDLPRQRADATNRLPSSTPAAESDAMLSVCGVSPEITHWPFSGVSLSCLSADNNLRRQLLLTGGSTEIQK